MFNVRGSTPLSPSSKRGSLTHSQALALSKRARDVTAPPVALNRCALRLAGHQSPRQDCFSRDEPAGVNTYKMVVRDGTAGRLSCYSTFDRITSGVVPISVIAEIL
mgnify:CR=1 FL=1